MLQDLHTHDLTWPFWGLLGLVVAASLPNEERRERVLDALASYRLSVATLGGLFVISWLGTGGSGIVSDCSLRPGMTSASVRPCPHHASQASGSQGSHPRVQSSATLPGSTSSKVAAKPSMLSGGRPSKRT